MIATVPRTEEEPAVCNICGSGSVFVLIRKDGRDVCQCRECGLGFTSPQPSSIANHYGPSYFELYRRRRRFRIRRAQTRLKRIELIKTPGKLLDIGCSLGYFIEVALARGWDACGIDISPYASQEARALGLDVHTGTLEEAGYPADSFDCITMWDVLEHVTDPTGHMLEVRRVLRADGLVAIGTPDLGHALFRVMRERWRHLKPEEHLFYFRKDALHRLLKKTGFVEVHPPLVGGRSFPGSLGAAIRAGLARLAQPNDVMTVYALKNGESVR